MSDHEDIDRTLTSDLYSDHVRGRRPDLTPTRIARRTRPGDPAFDRFSDYELLFLLGEYVRYGFPPTIVIREMTLRGLVVTPVPMRGIVAA